MSLDVAKKDVNGYTFDESNYVGEIASRAVRKYISSIRETTYLKNVESDKAYQKKDIDYVWKFVMNGEERVRKIEVKGDTYSHTGNIFLETVSNVGKGTPGCFLYSEADYFYYYFIDTRELNIIPLKQTRNWFEKNKHKYREVETSTIITTDGKELSLEEYRNGDYTEKARYYSLGKLVPKRILYKEAGVIRLKI